MADERETDGATARVYDFVHPDHRLATRWPVLELLHRQFVDDLALRLGQRFRIELGGESEPTRRARYADFVADLAGGTEVHELSLGTQPGVALLCLDGELVPMLVDGWFGGTPGPRPSATPREDAPDVDGDEASAADDEGEDGGVDADADTGSDDGVTATSGPNGVGRAGRGGVPRSSGSATERRALEHVRDAVLASLRESWSEIARLAPAFERATTPERLARGGYGDIVVDCPFTLLIGGCPVGCRLVYPVAVLEPFAERLVEEDHTHPLHDAGFREALGLGLMDCELELRGVLGETRVSLAELMALKPGDFIPLDDVGNVTFRTRRTPLFDARVGHRNGRISASLTDWHLPKRP